MQNSRFEKASRAALRNPQKLATEGELRGGAFAAVLPLLGAKNKRLPVVPVLIVKGGQGAQIAKNAISVV